MSAAVTAALPAPNPFPGLRPFQVAEEHLFFGRETQVDAMVDKLGATRFLAVVGTSGSGKSSLVNCGLVPALYRGLLAEAGCAWRVAMLRPGNRPIRALAEALAGPKALAPPPPEDDTFSAAELLEATLRMSKLGLIDAYRQAHLGPRQNLLVVVDQFEELFRYQSLAGQGTQAAQEATAFVNLLLEVGAHTNLPIYVVLSMRSDFLGDCAQFFGLPEAINRGQYLVPRMTRDQRRSAIEGPAGVSGATMDPVLVTRLVNDVGDNPDQLSILQHALNRTWACRQKERNEREGADMPLAMRHYEAIGTMAHALNQHAEEAYASLSPVQQALAEQLFRAITDLSTDARGTRRPTRMDTLCSITHATHAALTEVIDVFRAPSRSFLMPPVGTLLTPETPVDISHESLMRVWDRLRTWSETEARSAQVFRRLTETAELNVSGQAGLLRQPDLQFALDWQARQQPNPAWAQRLRPGLEAALDFLERSKLAHDEEQRLETQRRHEVARSRRLTRVVLPLTVFLTAVAVWTFKLYKNAEADRMAAVAAMQESERDKQAFQAADAQKRRAEVERERALAETRRNRWQQEQFAQAAQQSPALRAAVAQVEQSIQSKSLVYLQYAGAEQGGMMARLRSQLGKRGYSAPGAEKVGVTPSRSELRYFRKDDASAAQELADVLKTWGLAPVAVRYVPGHDDQTRGKQFEIWLAQVDAAAIGRLLTQLNADTPTERRAAGQTLQDLYTASPEAISQAMKLFEADARGELTDNGRINLLYFLTRTKPLAWDDALEKRARELISRYQARDDIGRMTRAEINRLERLLDAVKAGEATYPTLRMGTEAS